MDTTRHATQFRSSDHSLGQIRVCGMRHVAITKALQPQIALEMQTSGQPRKVAPIAVTARRIPEMLGSEKQTEKEKEKEEKNKPGAN